MKLVITVLDTTGIQPYIFGSNKLRENIGASHLVKQATDDWAKEALETLAQNHGKIIYFPDLDNVSADQKPHIEDGELIAELIYAGGGNTVLLFSELHYAKEFTQILSKRILKDAHGINLIAVHRENFDWHTESLYEAIEYLMKNDLDQKKQEQIPSSPLLGLGVTADCKSTRLVAVDTSDREEYGMPKDSAAYLISKAIGAKLKAVKPANDLLEDFIFDPQKPKRYGIPLDVDEMGRSEGESSYIAVVHADGNNMGKRFQEFGKNKPNRQYIIDMRCLSHTVNMAGKNALKELGKAIIDRLDREVLQDKLNIKGKKLPFRPLVYGGDDVTFVCDGRLGLELAALYLEEFAKQIVADGKPLTACAGVCIVKTHYPFARAYELSEALCRNAKQYLKKAKKKDGSALDWHLAASGLIGSIGEIREREYKVPNGDLTMRPLLMDDTDRYEWRTWQGFKKIVESFKTSKWQDKDGKHITVNRNKIIALREVLRKGSDATREFLSAYQISNLPIYHSDRDVNNLAGAGWLDGECGYFDAIEAMEFYVSLQEEVNE
jgi:hypothetical protein